MKLQLSPRPGLDVKPGRDVAGLQCLKLICAFLVVVIHTVGMWGGPLRVIASVAVPVFFMITGFFCVDATGRPDSGRIARMLWKLLVITVAAQVAYILFYVVKSAIAGEPPSDLWKIRSWITLFVVGDKFGGHLWYLTAAIEALAVIWLGVKMRLEKLLYLMIPLGLTFGLLAGAYAPLLGFETPERGFVHRNFFTLGLPCMMIGVAMRRRPLIGWKPALLWATTLLVLMLMLAEHYGLRLSPRGDFLILTIPAAVMLFQVFARSNPPKILADAGRRYSTGIYIIHLMVMWGVAELFTELAPSPWLAPVTFFLTLAILIVWRMVRRR